MNTFQLLFRSHGLLFASSQIAIKSDDLKRFSSLSKTLRSKGHEILQAIYNDHLKNNDFDVVRSETPPALKAWREAALVSQRSLGTYIDLDPGNLSRFERYNITASLEAALRSATLILLLSDPKAPLGKPSDLYDMAQQLRKAP